MQSAIRKGETEVASQGRNRRRHPRRKLPFGRSAVLLVDGRSHVVALVDLSCGGAYVATRVPVTPGENLVIKLFLPRMGGELTLPCELVRAIAKGTDEDPRLQGLAVRFKDLHPAVVATLEAFVQQGLYGQAD